jgi:hypothetical protein
MDNIVVIIYNLKLTLPYHLLVQSDHLFVVEHCYAYDALYTIRRRMLGSYAVRTGSVVRTALSLCIIMFSHHRTRAWHMVCLCKSSELSS